LRTTYISSSILYRSGSTKFGDELTDNHEFTGSLLVSGSLGINTNNPVALVDINTPNSTANYTNDLILNRPLSTNYHGFGLATDGTLDWTMGQNNRGAFEIYESGSAAKTRLSIIQGGSIGIGVDSPNSKLEVNGNIYTTSNTNFLLFGTNPAVNPYIQGGSDNSLYIGTGNASRLTISSFGAGTFTNTLSVRENVVNSTTFGSFDVQKTNESAINILGTTYSSIYFGDASNHLEGGIVYDHTNNTLEFRRSGNTNALVLSPTGTSTFSGNINVNSDGITIDRSTSGEAYIFFKKNGTTRASIYGADNEEGLIFFSTKSTFSGDIFLSKGSDPKIYAGTGVGLNIDGQALYLNRYTDSNITMVEGGGNVGFGTNSNEFKITSVDYDGYEKVTTLGSAQPTVKYAGSDRFNITTTNFYGGIRTQSSRWRYMRIEADIKSSNADHFGFFWSSNDASTIGIGDSNAGYKWVFHPDNTINIRDINSNADQQVSSTVPFDEKDGNWHHYVTEISHDGRVKIWVDGVLYHTIYGYNPGAGYCGIHNYSGTIEVSNFKITSLETQVQDVAFFAYHDAGDVNYTPSQILPYQNELFDYGGGYNTNGTFTAPVAGMYVFSATCNADVRDPYASTVPRAYWQINGANVGFHVHFRGNDLSGTATSGLTQRSATVIFYLNYGDTVRIQVQQGQWDLFGANHFCGYLLK
jgi:hypothetical protein